MPIDRKGLLPRQALELIRRRLAELTEELQAEFDPAFRQGVYILHTVDKAELPDDGLWLVFPSDTPIERGIASVEAGYNTLKNFIEAGLFEELENICKTKQNSPAAYPKLSRCRHLKKPGFIKRLFSSLISPASESSGVRTSGKSR